MGYWGAGVALKRKQAGQETKLLKSVPWVVKGGGKRSCSESDIGIITEGISIEQVFQWVLLCRRKEFW